MESRWSDVRIWITDTLDDMSDWVNSTWDTFNIWLIDHDQELNLALGWVLCVGFAFLALIKFITWLVIKNQHDETDVGKKLKRQKLFEAFLFALLSATYSLGLVLYYQGAEFTFSVWERLGIRFFLSVGMILAVFGGIAFVYSLKHENWGQASMIDEDDHAVYEVHADNG